jgi:hypothetical protein
VTCSPSVQPQYSWWFNFRIPLELSKKNGGNNGNQNMVRVGPFQKRAKIESFWGGYRSVVSFLLLKQIESTCHQHTKRFNLQFDRKKVAVNSLVYTCYFYFFEKVFRRALRERLLLSSFLRDAKQWKYRIEMSSKRAVGASSAMGATFSCGTHDGNNFWCNLDPCGLFCACVTWFLIAYGMLTVSLGNLFELCTWTIHRIWIRIQRVCFSSRWFHFTS